MKKQRNILIGLIAAVVLLAACVALLMQRNTASEAASSAAETANDIALFAADDAAAITYQYGGEITLQKDSEGVWQLQNDAETALDQTKVSAMLTAVCLISPSRVLPSDSDAAQYGLSPAAMTVTVTTADGTAHTVNFGDVNPVTGDVYLSVGDDTAIYTVGSQKLAAFEYSAADLAAPETAETAPDAEEQESADAAADQAAFEAAEAANAEIASAETAGTASAETATAETATGETAAK